MDGRVKGFLWLSLIWLLMIGGLGEAAEAAFNASKGGKLEEFITLACWVLFIGGEVGLMGLFFKQ